MSLPEFGVKKPVTNLMIFFSIILLALYSLTRLGIDMMPEIEPPSITVVSVYPGASPEDVEIKVTEPLEDQLATTPGVEKITSRSMEGVSLLTLKFIWGTNLDEASNNIRDRIDLAKRVLPDIPDEMDNPFIFKFNTSMIPILYLGITAEQTYPELYNLIDKRVGDVLRQIPGVGTVQLYGGLERQINVWLDRPRLEGYGFSVTDVMNIIRSENVTQPAGRIKSGLTDYLLRIPGEFSDPDEMNSVILGQRKGKMVYLKDVARVEDGFKEISDIVRINRKSGIMLMVQKQTGTNTVEVSARVKKKLKELVKTLPTDIKTYTMMDTSQDIVDSVKSLKETIWIGIFLVVLVVWFFLRQIRPSLIIAFTIPFSILIAFVYLFLAGKTINVISLSSLTIAIGLVVDDAIVVVDNITRHLEKGQRPNEAAIFGTSEMFLAISASTLTTVVVFLPMLFISGVVGIMFSELAMIVTVTLLGSLFTAATFTPMLCSKWMTNPVPARVIEQTSDSRTKDWSLKRLGQERAKIFAAFYAFSEKLFNDLEELYSRVLKWGLRHKKLVIYGFLGAFFMSLFLTRFVGNEFMPEEDSGDIHITVSMPVGTRVEETDKVASKIEDIIQKDVPEMVFMHMRSGQPKSGIAIIFSTSTGSHVLSGGLKLVKKDERKRSAKEVCQLLRTKILAIPGVIKLDITAGSPIGKLITGSGGKSVQVEIVGNSFEETNALAEKIKAIMEKTPGAVDISISRDMDRPELRVKVDREKGAALGLSMKSVSDNVKTFIEGSSATKYREKGETYDIYVRLDEEFRSKPEDVENLTFVSPFTGERLRSFTGNQIRLGNIADVYETTGPVTIERKNRERVVTVECNTYKRSMGKVIEDVKKEINALALPSDILIHFGGEAEEQGKAFRDLLLLLILGICLVYMVMAAQFESLLDPFIVMFAIPFTFTGVILGFLVTGTTLSVMTFLGIVMLVGIVVKNAIVLISYINILRARGYSVHDAITEGGKHRMRPVLMTTLTALMGFLPLALSHGQGSESWQPIGITMISGLSLSTLITMIFVPTLYSVFESRVKRGKKKQRS